MLIPVDNRQTGTTSPILYTLPPPLSLSNFSHSPKMSTYSLWCLIEGEKDLFKVMIPINSDVYDLKEEIKKTQSNFLQKVDASGLILWKVRYF
jgi:crinkler effector protein